MSKFLTWFERKRSSIQSALERSISAPEEKRSDDRAEILRKQGGACLQKGELDAAFEYFTQGARLNPEDALCFSNLGFILAARGDAAGAMAMLRKALALDPENYDAYFMMGNLLAGTEHYQAAVESYERALSIKPDFFPCRDALCGLMMHSRELGKARSVLLAGFKHERDLANYYVKSANLCIAEGFFDKAAVDFNKALKFRPDDISILNSLAESQIEMRDVGAAIATCQSILRYQPENIQAACNLGVAYLLNGSYELALQSIRNALNVDPAYLVAHQNLLYMLSFGISCSPQEYLKVALAYGEKVSAMANPYSSWLCSDTAGHSRPLRVGLVSGDFHQHPVGYFLESIVQNMDATRVSLFAYSCSGIEDALSLRIKPHFKEWNMVAALSDRDLAEKIHADAIDILLDLSGHTQMNRLSMFAWRAAPIQASWLGYWSSTGVREIDYLLTDELSAPASEQGFYSEKLCYLPSTRFCFSVPNLDRDLVVGRAPACESSFVTFGSYQAVHKITDKTLQLWARVLTEVPMSRLRIQNAQMDFPDVLAGLRDRLGKSGVDTSRVAFFGHADRQAYLRSYGEVDMVLDTFPYPGGTTTVEALWMGVPTITLKGQTLLARQGESILNCVGLRSFVAQDEDDFVAIAVRQAADVANLNALRQSMRAASLKSTLFDAPRFANNLADALEAMKIAGPRG